MTAVAVSITADICDVCGESITDTSIMNCQIIGDPSRDTPAIVASGKGLVHLHDLLITARPLTSWRGFLRYKLAGARLRIASALRTRPGRFILAGMVHLATFAGAVVIGAYCGIFLPLYAALPIGLLGSLGLSVLGALLATRIRTPRRPRKENR